MGFLEQSASFAALDLKLLKGRATNYIAMSDSGESGLKLNFKAVELAVAVKPNWSFEELVKQADFFS